MKGKSSTLYILFILLGISVAIVGIFLGCDQNKQVNPPVLGPAAGSGPMGGGETQRVTIINEPTRLYLPEGEASTLEIVALIENNIGQPMPDGTPVYWSTEGGDSSTATTSNGSSSFTLNISKDFEDCTTITARSGDASDTIKICVTRMDATATPSPTPTATATPSRTLTVSANPSTITLPGPPTTSIITACAFIGGTADPNVQVNFTITTNPAGVGTLNRTSALTNASGCNPNAAPNDVTFTAVSAGTATITATTADGRTANVSILVN